MVSVRLPASPHVRLLVLSEIKAVRARSNLTIFTLFIGRLFIALNSLLCCVSVKDDVLDTTKVKIKR